MLGPLCTDILEQETTAPRNLKVGVHRVGEEVLSRFSSLEWRWGGRLNQKLEGNVLHFPLSRSSSPDSHSGTSSYFHHCGRDGNRNRNPHHPLSTHESQRLTFLVHYVFGTIFDGTRHLISSVFVATSENGCYHYYPYFTGEKRGEQRLSNLPKITQDSGWSLQSSTPGSRIHCLTHWCTKGQGGRSYSHGV